MKRARRLGYISLLAAIAVVPLSNRTMAQATTTDLPTPALSADEVLVMFVMPLPKTDKEYTVCLDETVIGSLSKLSYITTVTAAGWHMLWCDARTQWLHLKPGGKYALVLGQPRSSWAPGPTASTGVTTGNFTLTASSSSGADQGPEWFLEDFDEAARLVRQLSARHQEALLEEAPAKKYEKQQNRIREIPAEIQFPVEFSRIHHRSDKETPEYDLEKKFLRKAKGWTSSGRWAGKLRIDERAVRFESRERMLEIPVSAIENVGFGKLVDNRPWLSVRYRDGSRTRTAYLARDYGDFNSLFFALIEASEGESTAAVDAAQ